MDVLPKLTDLKMIFTIRIGKEPGEGVGAIVVLPGFWWL